jgi:ABC-type glycerol-3-phosphate transport system substrate-binding protein
VDACRKLKRAGILPLMLGASDGFNIHYYTQQSAMEFGNSLAELPGFFIGKTPVDSPVVSGWIDQNEQLRQDGLVNADAGEITEGQALSRFGKGEGAFLMSNIGNISGLSNADDFTIVPLWDGPGAIGSVVAAAADGLMLAKSAENKEAAGKFTEFVHQPPQLELYHKVTGSLPCDRRFDIEPLNRPAREFMLALRDADPVAVWPYEHIPATGVTIGFELGSAVAAGRLSPSEARKSYEERVARYQDQNSQEVEQLTKYVETLE